MNDKALPHPMGKQQLAQLYFPRSEAHAAVNHLNAWIRRCTPLACALETLPTHNRHAKLYTAREVALITHFLGPP